ncbi:uncharacterized protein F5147DRAFT_719783 [Suillus discolor]|uniref:Uncharacterized protein n=1 Tax=Suillus discolor TaxID=1912936 RepID=A0A9P7EVW3_9AGAM|nr:uncharacterized protein F5147DRAFT_719783 [Suillus discolor]KAG2094209.1 hypothetical protein F5147DRAFT_719783 [Suillus discolor]
MAVVLDSTAHRCYLWFLLVGFCGTTSHFWFPKRGSQLHFSATFKPLDRLRTRFRNRKYYDREKAWIVLSCGPS